MDEAVLEITAVAASLSEDFEYELELLEVNKLNKNTVQLHYKVLK